MGTLETGRFCRPGNVPVVARQVIFEKGAFEAFARTLQGAAEIIRRGVTEGHQTLIQSQRALHFFGTDFGTLAENQQALHQVL